MNSPKSLRTALCLSESNVVALVQGRTIAAISKTFIRTGQDFALCPYDEMSNSISAQSHQVALSSTGSSQQLNVKTLTIDAWASCELCQIIDASYKVRDFVKLANFPLEELKILLQETHHAFLVYLRVYRFSQPIDVNTESVEVDRVGKFFGLPIAQNTSGSYPVLSDRIFAQRKRQLENLEPPEYPELESLHSTIAQLSHPKALLFAQQIAEFLGWSEPSLQSNPDLTWIRTINDLATRSKEPDDAKKSNYQAGTDFEIVTRQGLAYLGFKVEEDYRGGAGGLDLFCSEPYPLVGECKSGKSITDRAVEELDRIGKRHLQENYTKATRLIIGPGSPTPNLQVSAIISKTSILGAMTFQKLVELQAQYPGSVNLIELKNCLKPGQSDEAIEQYINTVSESIQLRSHIVQVVRDCLEKLKTDSAGVSEFHTAYVFSAPPCSLDPKELHEILLELASPLTGYLGRIKGNQWENDRFYFLRPFHLNTTS